MLHASQTGPSEHKINIIYDSWYLRCNPNSGNSFEAFDHVFRCSISVHLPSAVHLSKFVACLTLYPFPFISGSPFQSLLTKLLAKQSITVPSIRSECAVEELLRNQTTINLVCVFSRIVCLLIFSQLSFVERNFKQIPFVLMRISIFFCQ